MAAIERHETGGKCDARGKSGEGGCLQYLPGTWRAHSMIIFGEVRKMSPVTEKYVATKMVEKWLEEGYTVQQIPLLWNQGNTGKCSSGINRHGVPYNSCEYQRRVLSMIQV